MSCLPLFVAAICVAGHQPDREAMAACYAAVDPALEQSNGLITPEVRKAYLGWAESTVLTQLQKANQKAPDDCLAEVRQDPTLYAAIYGAVFPPDPSILQNYAALRKELGPQFLRNYRQLVIGVSVAKRIKGVETTDGPDIGQDYQPGFWGDETFHPPGSDAEKQLVRSTADFMSAQKVAALDLYQKPELQKQLTAYLQTKGVSGDLIGQIKETTQFGEWLKNAMVLLGQRPAARDPKPKTVDWLRRLATEFESTPISTPQLDSRPKSWPLFPLDIAPWPLLMPLAHSVQLSEANYIWDAYQGKHGDDRYHTYGPYRGDADAMPDMLKPSKWFWDAWPDRIVHGGMCVPISKGTVDLYSALGKPAMWAGQPGHANLVSFQTVGNEWFAEVEQDYAGGPRVTCAQWYFGDDPDEVVHYRDLYWWPGAEYHLGLPLAMDIGLDSYMDTRLATYIYQSMPADKQSSLGTLLLKNALQENPFNPDLWYRLAQQTEGAMLGVRLIQAVAAGDPGRLVRQPDTPAVAKFLGGKHSGQVTNDLNQYWQTIEQYATGYSILGHSSPGDEEQALRVYGLLRAVPGLSPYSLADYTDSLSGKCPPELKVQAVRYDQNLADRNDPFGLLRMGQRYRDGDGVQVDLGRSVDLLSQAAALGEPSAPIDLEALFPSVSPDNIAVTASSTFGPGQVAQHLIDGSGMTGETHNNDGNAGSMWCTAQNPKPTVPTAGVLASPAWVRFDFAQPQKFDAIQIWNLSQAEHTDRGLRHVHVYGTIDGVNWSPVIYGDTVELPRGVDTPFGEPMTYPTVTPDKAFKSVVLSADDNYGAAYFGLDAVRFVVRPYLKLIPGSEISVSASSQGHDQVAQHLIDGSGMFGRYHDNNTFAFSMWHIGAATSTAAAPGLPVSPAWVRFDFAKPRSIESFVIWNHNQENLTDRGFRKTHIYGTVDGTAWVPLTQSDGVELPRANGTAYGEATTVANAQADLKLKAVAIEADEKDGSYGSTCYGLSAVRFVIRY